MDLNLTLLGTAEAICARTLKLTVLFDLIEKEGLSLGTSCGINIAGAIRMGKELGPGKTIVTILCDRSDKYATKMFNKKFLEEKGLPVPNWF